MVGLQILMFLLQSFKHGYDALHFDFSHSCMHLIKGGTLDFCRPSRMNHVTLQLARICMHLLQKLAPTHEAGCFTIAGYPFGPDIHIVMRTGGYNLRHPHEDRWCQT